MSEVGGAVGGRYRVDRELESGPGAQSLLVTDLRNGRPCVLRQLSVAAVAPAAARRFEAQAAILAKLDFPGLPRFIDGFSEGEGDALVRSIVTSYHPGESLERLVAKGRPLTESQALVLLRRIVPVLAYLHGFDPPLVHRTISASGIILGPDGRPCLTDLDYAVAGEESPSPEQAPPGPDELALAAPEVFMGGAVPASDIYALGLAVCRGMTARDPAALLREGAKVPLRGALGVSEAFAAVLGRMLEASPEKRYADARALEADLARLAGVRVVPAQQQPAARPPEEPRPPRRARPLVLAGVAGALVVLALALVFLRNRAPAPTESLLADPASRESAAAPSTGMQDRPATTPTADVSTPTQPPAVGDDAAAAPAAPSPAPAPPSTAGVDPAPVTAGSPGAAPLPTTPAAAAPDQSSAAVPVLPAAAPAAAVDSVPVAARGRLLFDGKPYAKSAAPPPQFWFREEGRKAEAKPQVEYADGAFTVRGLPPGRYAMSVRIDLEPGNPKTYPGDLTAWEEFTIGAGAPASVDVSLRTVMHMAQPFDNGVIMPGWDVPCGAGNVSPGRLVLSWDALAPGTRYDVSVDRLACKGGAAPAGRVFASSTTEAWMKVELPPNLEGEFYSLRLTANRDGRTVGIMNTHGKSGIGWDYRFTVAGR